jgi:hypothetical protein
LHRSSRFAGSGIQSIGMRYRLGYSKVCALRCGKAGRLHGTNNETSSY